MKPRAIRSGSAAAATVMVVAALASCASSEADPSDTDPGSGAEGSAFQPIEEDTLTVNIPSLPADGNFDGLDPDNPGEGMGMAMMKQLAEGFGLSEVKVVIRDFAASTAGLVTDFDVMFSPSPTEERKKVAEFTPCFWSNPTAVMTHKDTVPTSVEDLKSLKWGLTPGGLPSAIIREDLRPEQEPAQFQNTTALFPSLLNGTIDAAPGTIKEIVPWLNNPDYKDFHISVQLKPSAQNQESSCQAILLPKGSPNVELVSESVQRMADEGQLQDWFDQYVLPTRGGIDLDEIPVIDLTNQ